MGIGDDIKQIASWFELHAPPLHQRLEAGAPPDVATSLAAELGVEIPEDFAEYLLACNGTLAFFEYSGLTPIEIARVRNQWEEARKRGAFDQAEPPDDDRGIFAETHWHSAWIPFAEDGGGNLFLIDLAPGTGGKVGQVLRWEIGGGPCCWGVRSFGQYLERYRELLLAGGYTFDADSHTFDGWNDDERP
ncbi:MAG: SMI1/KNR4 family protein [Polyangiaceae bacterium]